MAKTKMTGGERVMMGYLIRAEAMAAAHGAPYRGVRRMGTRWSARIKRNGVEHHLGHFDTAEEASVAYVEARTVLRGRR